MSLISIVPKPIIIDYLFKLYATKLETIRQQQTWQKMVIKSVCKVTTKLFMGVTPWVHNMPPFYIVTEKKTMSISQTPWHQL